MRLSTFFVRTRWLERGKRGGRAPLARERLVGRFQTTRRSLVLRAGAVDGRGALSELCQAYAEPIRSFLLSQGARPDEVDDLSQGLFESLHRRRDIGKFDPSRGRFRSWLCACAKHYLFNFRDHQNSQAAGHGHVIVGLDDAGAEERQLSPDEGLTPERLFNRRWALTVVSRSLARLRDFYAARGDGALFESLQATLSGEGSEVTDAELSELLGKSRGAVRVDRHRIKADMQWRYQQYLREEIGETVSHPGAIDDEIRELLAALD